MHIVVVGCGRVGSGLAEAAEAAGHTVGIIDRREQAFRRLSPEFSGKKLVGVGFDRDRLEEAGIKDAFAVASVTNGDNSNIMIARVAKETYGIDRVVARIYDPRRAAIYERLGIPTVATVQWTIERVLRRVLPESHAVEWIDPSARVCLIERGVPAAWAGRDVSDLDIDGEARVIAVSRLGVSQLARPKLVIQDGDLVYAAVNGDKIGAFDARLSGTATAGAH
ncbi:MAG TPA: TrkA family potassium uptake protein [Acidimicrobiales bacterium]|nr:TrkA family potassium uptake protein [Acidimicrobiales bacterium]